MYEIRIDEKLFFRSGLPGYGILEGNLKRRINKAGCLTVKIPFKHRLYDLPKKMQSIVTVSKNKKTIFRGRVLDDEIGLYRSKELICEGQLAFLNDSTVRPYTYTGTIKPYLEMLIEQHNNQVDSARQFAVGTVTVEGSLKIESKDYPKTWQEVEDRLLDEYEGYLFVRELNGIYYIDYLAGVTAENDQEIAFGENLIDLSILQKGRDIFTVLIPLSKQSEGYLTIASVNDGKDYLENEEAIKSYGRIERKVEYNNITDPEELMALGETDLKTAASIMETITATAADLAMAGYSFQSFEFGTYEWVKSAPHGIYKRMLITSMDTDLLNWEKNKLTIGQSISTYTGSLREVQKEQEKMLVKESTERQKAIEKLAASMASAGGLYTTKVTATNGGIIFYLHDKATLAESTTVVKINQAGIGVSMDGGKNYTNGFLFNGTAILQEIYTVGIDASYIKTGELVVKNADGTVLFKVSMATGEVLINSGTLKVGDGYIKTDGSFKLGPMESTGDDHEDVLFKRAIMVNYGIEIYGDNDDENKLAYLDFHSGTDVSSGDSEYDYTGRIHNYMDSGSVSQFHFSGYHKKTGESGTCNVNVNGTIVHTSDRRLKEEIAYLDPEESEAFLMQLKPAQYKYLQDPAKKIHKGLIYDEVEAASGGQDLALLATFLQGKEKYGALSYTELIPDMIAMLQKQQREIEALKK